MSPRIFAVATTALVLFMTSGNFAQEKTSKDDQARAIAEKFVRAIKIENDMDKLMKLVAVPFLVRNHGKDTMLFEKTEDAKEWLTRKMKEQGGEVWTGTLTSREVVVYDEKCEYWNWFDEDKILKKSDRIVMVEMRPEQCTVITLVTWRDNQPKVAGFDVFCAK